MTSVSDARGRAAAPALGTFERYLTVWVALCIVTGIILGHFFPAPLQALGRMTVAEVNIPVALLIWLMIVPMLLKVDFGALHRVAGPTLIRSEAWPSEFVMITAALTC